MDRYDLDRFWKQNNALRRLPVIYNKQSCSKSKILKIVLYNLQDINKYRSSALKISLNNRL